MVGATELAFAAGMTRMTLLPGVAITSRGYVETGSPRAFLASTAGSWRAITEGASTMSARECRN
jgi:hypothetical protein